MKAFKVELLVIDRAGLGAAGIECALESAQYSGWCGGPKVIRVTGVDIQDWREDHPLNLRCPTPSEFEQLFPPLPKLVAEWREMREHCDLMATSCKHDKDFDGKARYEARGLMYARCIEAAECLMAATP